MRFNDNPLSGLRLMSEDERDREMRQYFAERAAEEQPEASTRTAKWRKPDETPVTTSTPAFDQSHPDAAGVGKGGSSSIDKTGDAALDRLLAELDDDGEREQASALALFTPATSPATVTAEKSGPAAAEARTDKATTAEAPTAPAATAIMPAVVAAKDSFPVHDGQHLSTEDDPAARLQVLCSELARHHDYDAIRVEYCNLSIRMNLLGTVAPAFRPRIKPSKPKNDPVYQLIHRDQLVIDMHWCHVRGFSLSPTEPEHAALFASQASFTFAGAWALASRKLKKAYRAGEALCLTTLQQCQLVTLRDPELTERTDRIERGYLSSGGKSVSEQARARRAIKQWAERDPRIKKVQRVYEQLWYARELLGAGATREQIAVLQALMAGSDQLHTTTISEKLKKLDKALSSM